MKKTDQITRVNDFIEKLAQPDNPDGLILLDSELDSWGSIDPLISYQNGGNCKNDLVGDCGTNKKNCVNVGSACINSTNGGDCENKMAVGNCLQVCF